jgi:hypothetical protein
LNPLLDDLLVVLLVDFAVTSLVTFLVFDAAGLVAFVVFVLFAPFALTAKVPSLLFLISYKQHIILLLINKHEHNGFSRQYVFI